MKIYKFVDVGKQTQFIPTKGGTKPISKQKPALSQVEGKEACPPSL